MGKVFRDNYYSEYSIENTISCKFIILPSNTLVKYTYPTNICWSDYAYGTKNRSSGTPGRIEIKVISGVEKPCVYYNNIWYWFDEDIDNFPTFTKIYVGNPI